MPPAVLAVPRGVFGHRGFQPCRVETCVVQLAFGSLEPRVGVGDVLVVADDVVSSSAAESGERSEAARVRPRGV